MSNNTSPLEDSFKELYKLYSEKDKKGNITGIAEDSRALFHKMHREHYDPLCKYYKNHKVYTEYNNPTFLFPIKSFVNEQTWGDISNFCEYLKTNNVILNNIIKIPPKIEYKTNPNLYIQLFKKLIYGGTQLQTSTLKIIAGNRSDDGLLYNDSTLINDVCNLASSGKDVQFALLQERDVGVTPDGLLKKIKDDTTSQKTLQNNIKLYEVYKSNAIDNIRSNLQNQVRIILTDYGCKITRRTADQDKCSIFIFKTGEGEIKNDSTVPKIIPEIQRKANEWYEEIKQYTNNIFGRLETEEKANIEENKNKKKEEEKKSIILKFDGIDGIKYFGNTTEQITQAIEDLGNKIDGLGEEMKGVREEMAKLPNAIAQEMAKILQQSNKKDTDILDYIKKSAETSDAILKFLNTATKLGS